MRGHFKRDWGGGMFATFTEWVAELCARSSLLGLALRAPIRKSRLMKFGSSFTSIASGRMAPGWADHREILTGSASRGLRQES